MSTTQERERTGLLARFGVLGLAIASLLLLVGAGSGETNRSRTDAGERVDPASDVRAGDVLVGDLRGCGRVPVDWCGNGNGGLHLVVDGHTVQRDFPLKHTRVDAQVSGSVANVTVTQVFANPYAETIEAVYVFPLPHEAAVSDMTMQLGERTIRGIIERRDEARRIYENARDSGHVAALLEEERANIFTQSVANILPGNEIEITIEYVETLDYESGVYEFVYPMVVGPRFIPPGEVGDVVPAGSGRRHAGPPSTGVADADRITPPYLPPSIRSGHDIEVNVEWDAAIAIQELTSVSHRVEIDRRGTSRAMIRLHANDQIPNKDLVLRCRVAGDQAQTGVLAHHDGEDGFLTLLLHPKVDLSPSDVTPKEMIFVLDCSGSMSGEPMAAAKALVRHALRNVNERDTFQIIRFSSQASGLAPAPLDATPQNVARGIAYIDQLSGGGGTMMIEGIKASLGFPEDPERLRMVMFLTDGYIGNDDQILAEVRSRIGSARLFSFGVGSSVNRFLLDRMAEEGRGEVQYFLPGSSVRDEVETFYGRIRNPYLTDIRIDWDGVAVSEAFPHRIPDLFDGRPLTVHARYGGGGNGKVRVSGRIAGRAWSQEIDLDLPRHEAGNPAVANLWARAKIAGLEKQMVHGAVPSIVEDITKLGLRHRLVTRYTSFVAVEERIEVSNGRPKTVLVPLTMPEGVSFEGVFGETDKAVPQAPMSRGVVGRLLGGWSASPGTMAAEPKKEILSSKDTVSLSALEEEDRDSSRQRRDRKTVLRDEPVRRPADSLAGMASALRVEMEAPRGGTRSGAGLELTITLTNDGLYDLSVPATLDLDSVWLRVVDSQWREVRLGKGQPPSTMRVLRAGESVTLRLSLTGEQASFLTVSGTYHLTLEGSWLTATAGSARVTLHVL